MDKNYNPPKKLDAYEAELNRLASQCGPLRAFTDEENVYMHNQLNEGINEFFVQDIKDKFESELESRKIFVD